MIHRSYGVKVALWSCLATGVVIIIFMTSVVFNVKNEFAELVDHDMEAIALALMTNASSRKFSENPFENILHFDPGSFRGEIYADDENIKEAKRNLVLIALLDADGSFLFRNKNYWKNEYLLTFKDTTSLEVGKFLSEQDYENAVKDPDTDFSDRWEIRLYKKDGRQLFLAINQYEYKDEYLELILLFAVELPLVLVATAISGWWLGIYTLKPINTIRRSISGVNAENLGNRIPMGDRKDEIGELAVQINSMLERVESGYVQVKQFTADASHELRTPLAIIQAELEMNLRDCAESANSTVRILEEIHRLKSLTNSLLLLSKSDSDTLDLVFTPQNLTEITEQAFEDVKCLPNDYNLNFHIRNDLLDPININCDGVLIQQAIFNLLKNAARFNEQNGKVECNIYKNQKYAQVLVGNTGPGIPESKASSIFGRFYRVNNHQGKELGGFGLGLNISRALIRAHGGEVRLVSSQKKWTEFEIQIPLSPGELD